MMIHDKLINHRNLWVSYFSDKPMLLCCGLFVNGVEWGPNPLMSCFLFPVYWQCLGVCLILKPCVNCYDRSYVGGSAGKRQLQ